MHDRTRAAARTTASVRLRLDRDELEIIFVATDCSEPLRPRRAARSAASLSPTATLFAGKPPRTMNALADLW